MSIEGDVKKKVAQLIITGIPSTQLGDKEVKTLSHLGLGGVILFARNYEELKQLVELNNNIQKNIMLGSYNGMPGWICVDHEGGSVQRFGEPFTQIPPASVWGELNSPKTAFEMAYVMAKELNVAGVGVNFAPVIDVPKNLEFAALGDRVFGTDAEMIAALGSATVRGLQKGGVLAVAKHFPGHGAVNLDSHDELPVCDLELAEVEREHWLPFRRVIRARCEGVMTAHIVYSKIDPGRPATFSRTLLNDHLRKSMRYSKLIFSDDLEMGAISNQYSLEDAAFLAVDAGCDQILICHSIDKVESIVNHLTKAFVDGVIPMKKLDDSIERIMESKKQFLMPFKLSDLSLAQAVVGAPDFRDVASAIDNKTPIEEGPSSKTKMSA